MTQARWSHRLVLLVVLGFAASSEPLHADVAPREVRFTWRDVVADRVAIDCVNSSTMPLTFTGRIQRIIVDNNTPPELVVNPKTQSVPASNTITFELHLAPDAKVSPGADFTYLLSIDRAHGNETTTERTLVRVRPVFWLPPQTSTRLVLNASRDVPFVQPWTIASPLPLRAALPPDVIKSAERQPLGVVQSMTTPGLEASGIVSVGSSPANKLATSLPLDLAFPSWASAKMTGTLTLPDGQTRDVVVQTSDAVIYPLLVIVIGVIAAFGVKRFLTRGRVALVLRATLSDIETRLMAAHRTFRRTASLPFDAFDIVPAWRQFRKDVEADLDLVELEGGPLNATNTDFVTLNAKVAAAKPLPSTWTNFGVTLHTLATLRNAIAAIASPEGVQGRPTIELEMNKAETGSTFPTLDEFRAQTIRVDGLAAIAPVWRAAWDRSTRLGAIAAQNAPALASVVTAQRRLWEGFDSVTISDVTQLLNQATDAAVASGQQAVARQETLAPVLPPFARQPPTEEQIEIERGDALTMLVALATAVIVGLNAEYFGKPFGSVADYARVLAWALTASIGVDLAAQAVDRVGSLFSGTAGVTRA